MPKDCRPCRRQYKWNCSRHPAHSCLTDSRFQRRTAPLAASGHTRPCLCHRFWEAHIASCRWCKCCNKPGRCRRMDYMTSSQAPRTGRTHCKLGAACRIPGRTYWSRTCSRPDTSGRPRFRRTCHWFRTRSCPCRCKYRADPARQRRPPRIDPVSQADRSSGRRPGSCFRSNTRPRTGSNYTRWRPCKSDRWLSSRCRGRWSYP